MAKRVKIIGAGVAGLSTASYLQRNGYDTEIYEMHSLPGGLCTAWKKKGYTFDGCINWLVGSNPVHPLYSIWNEVLDMKSVKCVEMDIYAKIEDDRGNSLTLYSDADKFGTELKHHAPEHPDLADEIVKGIKLFALKDERDEAVKEQKDSYTKKGCL